MTAHNVENFDFEEFLKFFKENDSGEGVYLGRLVDFDVRMVKEYPDFLDNVMEVLKDLGYVHSYGIKNHITGRKSFVKVTVVLLIY